MLIGLNGVILVAYIVAIPANEIVIPTVLMLTVLCVRATGVGAGAGVMFELDSANETGDLLRAGGWTLLTGINLMLFSLLHNPCSTTIYTIWKETGSAKWTIVATLLPLVLGFIVCFFVAQIWYLLAGCSHPSPTTRVTQDRTRPARHCGHASSRTGLSRSDHRTPKCGHPSCAAATLFATHGPKCGPHSGSSSPSAASEFFVRQRLVVFDQLDVFPQLLDRVRTNHAAWPRRARPSA